ncbi:MAG: dephospho-CoA kinase [Deltaproteobacteria bacterium]|jgi:dephospho-CoA kinase|nr:dephospho-CoA kinase [Deltaproteobacteria bacterium]
MAETPKRPKISKRPEDPKVPPWASDPEGLLKSRPGSIKIALTGGLATGKSTVAALFEVFGASRLDFDRYARQAVAPDSPGLSEVVKLFGPGCLLPGGEMNRTFVGKKVFKDPVLRKGLEDIIHPETWKLMLQNLKSPNLKPVTVIEIPLLFEAGLETLFDHVLLSFAAPETQLRRLLFRDPKLGKSLAKKMIAAQTPILEKLRRAKSVVNNDGPLARTIYQTKDLWDALIKNLDPPAQTSGLAPDPMRPNHKNGRD